MDGVDLVLIIEAIIFFVLIAISALYFLVYFQHPEDNWVAWAPKIVVMIGLILACCNILLLPLDVQNQRGEAVNKGSLPMELFSIMFFVLTAIFAIIIVPFMMFYYEGYDDSDETTKRQYIYATKWSLPTSTIVIGVIVVLWILFGDITIVRKEVSSTLIPAENFDYTINSCESSNACYIEKIVENDVRVSIFMYIIAVISFVGWFLFSIFGGIGLITLPSDLISSFKNRPRPIGKEKYKKLKNEIGLRAASLMEKSKEIDKLREDSKNKSRFSKEVKELKRKEKEFQKSILKLEDSYNKMEDSYTEKGGNILVQFAKLLLGIFGGILSLVWVIHIILYSLMKSFNAEPISTFLSSILSTLSAIPFVGTALYASLAFWLLASVVNGNMKFGMKFEIFAIHPLVIKGTLMNSLLYNVGIILFTSVAIVQFMSSALGEYAKYTTSQRNFWS
ncbi:hypothetical protein BCR32DRAFT_326025 [Anaeromyces robustus]|uniref:LMBR1-domain-containing protein n=1 Tax=Anaeromyces robustus TaxID=1754192 RepID=A0A1Y1XER0_9FUNG|nr:hypothetical protein BCR32DRAFT_326025 [Anaeromyces robustus]|eukprot:ORX84225.1 hypothetical protein BCR32DRAFT_326025 [Anaeromyces robustus]